jgi:hypothetical protein
MKKSLKNRYVLCSGISPVRFTYVHEKFTISYGNVRLTFTGKAALNAQGDGGVSMTALRFPV